MPPVLIRSDRHHYTPRPEESLMKWPRYVYTFKSSLYLAYSSVTIQVKTKRDYHSLSQGLLYEQKLIFRLVRNIPTNQSVSSCSYGEKLSHLPREKFPAVTKETTKVKLSGCSYMLWSYATKLSRPPRSIARVSLPRKTFRLI